MKTKELVIMALFAAIGAVLHSIMPPVLFGMKPDMMLVMMFMGILLFPRVQNVLMIGISRSSVRSAHGGITEYP